MHTIPFIVHFIQVHEYWANLLLFLGVFWEGEIMLIISGILVHQGALHLESTIAISLGAAFMKTVLGYLIGVWTARRFPNSKFLRYIERRILLLLPKFKERPFWSIFISKFIYGVNNATLVFAGYMKANFRIYVRAEVISTIIWLAGFIWLGYFFSYAAFSISHDVRKVVILILAFITCFILLQRFISFLYDLVEFEDKE